METAEEEGWPVGGGADAHGWCPRKHRGGGIHRVRDEASIEQEAALDGIYVIRTSEPKKRLSAEDTVRSYKNPGLQPVPGSHPEPQPQSPTKLASRPSPELRSNSPRWDQVRSVRYRRPETLKNANRSLTTNSLFMDTATTRASQARPAGRRSPACHWVTSDDERRYANSAHGQADGA